MSLTPWDHLRALLVSLHLAVVILASIPPPPPMTDAHLAQPAAARELASWQAAAAKIGIAPDTFRSALVGSARVLRDARLALAEVADPYARCCGTRQLWSMFGTVNHAPGRVEVWVEEHGAWRALFVPLRPDATWREGQLRSERMRAVLNNYANGQQADAYRAFARWAARAVSEDFPDATRVKVQVVRIRPPEPEDLARTGEVPVDPPRQVIEIELGSHP